MGNKKLLAVALAGVLAGSGAARAQSSVNVSGWAHISIDNVSYGNAAAARTTKSESRVNDQASRIIFSATEDLGGGLAALVRVETRPNIDTSVITAAGVSYIGLNSKQAGRFTVGRHNLHRNKTPWDGQRLSVPLQIRPNGLVDFAGAGRVPIANASRTPNSLMWSSPNWGGFAVDAGYSFNANGSTVTEADMTAGNTARKGRAWNVNPSYTGAHWQIAYTHWDAKADAPTAAIAVADQRSDSLYGYYTWGGLKVGAMWNTSRLNTAAGPTAGAKVSERRAWSIPIRYTFGNHHILAHYTKVGDDKVLGAGTGAKELAIAVAHSLSKRTKVSLSYAKVSNGAAAAFNLDINTVSVNAAPAAGENPRVLAVAMRHDF